MNNNNKLHSFYKDRFDSCKLNLKNAKQLNADDIHQLRIDIKNIRNMLLFLQDFNLKKDGTEAEMVKHLQPVFKNAGRLRTIHLCKSLLLDYSSEVPSEVEEQLEKEKDIEERKFKKSLNKFDVNVFDKKLDDLDTYLNAIENKQVESVADQMIHNELDVIYKLWASSKGEEHFHDIRKLFKIIKTLLQLLLTLENREHLKKELAIVNQAETLLGDWHDLDVLDQKLTKNYSKQASLNVYLRKLKAYIRNAKKSLAKEFHQIMRTHFVKI